MFTTIVVCFGLYFAAYIFSKIGPMLIGLAGIPGSLIAWPIHDKTFTFRKILGFIISLIGQAIVSLIFILVTIPFVRINAAKPDTWGWLMWIFGFFTAITPIAVMTKEYQRIPIEVSDTNPNHQFDGLILTLLSIAVPSAYVVFAIWPNIMQVMLSWLPLTLL